MIPDIEWRCMVCGGEVYKSLSMCDECARIQKEGTWGETLDMKKLNCYICDGCRKVLHEPFKTTKGKKKELHYCDTCYEEKHTLRKN